MHPSKRISAPSSLTAFLPAFINLSKVDFLSLAKLSNFVFIDLVEQYFFSKPDLIILFLKVSLFSDKGDKILI